MQTAVARTLGPYRVANPSKTGLDTGSVETRRLGHRLAGRKIKLDSAKMSNTRSNCSSEIPRRWFVVQGSTQYFTCLILHRQAMLGCPSAKATLQNDVEFKRHDAGHGALHRNNPNLRTKRSAINRPQGRIPDPWTPKTGKPVACEMSRCDQLNAQLPRTNETASLD